MRALPPAIGAEVAGTDLTQRVSDPIRDQIKELILRYKVPLVRNKHIMRKQYFAPTVRRSGRFTWDGCHTGTSWRLVPTWGAVLRAVIRPERGGDTIWGDASLEPRRLERVLIADEPLSADL